MQKMTTLILIRHAETEANASGIWQGSQDAPLTPRGEAQVTATAQRFGDWALSTTFDQLYVSPLARAQSTAAGIAAATGLEPQIEPKLAEFHLGDWEGRSFIDLRDTEDLWGRWAVDRKFAPPNGESPHIFYLRAVSALSEIAERHPHETVIVVTHGGFIANVLSGWLGEGPGEWRKWEAHNCAITILESIGPENIELENTGKGWRGVLINDITHLPPEAIEHPDYSAYA
jgi:probable phosphoglycerate mutase